MKMTLASPKKTAAWHYDNGANVLPLDGKAPIPKWKDFQSERQPIEVVTDYPWDEATGVGVVHGIGGRRCIDIDDCGLFAPVERILDGLGFPHTYPWIVRSGSGEGWHIWISCPDDSAFNNRETWIPKRGDDFDHLEVRWNRHQTAVPPSVHPDTGAAYEFINSRPEGAPWEVSAEKVEESLRAVAKPKHKSSATGRNGRSFDVPETISEGERNNALTSVAGTLRNRGFSAEEMEQMLETVNENRCSPPLSDDEVQKIARSVERYEPGNPVTNGQSEGSNPADPGDPWAPVRNAYDSNKAKGRVGSASQLIEEFNLATHRRSNQLYVWDKEQKVYDEGGEQTVRERLVETLETRFSQHEVNEILGMIRPRTYRDQFGVDGFIPVANGDLKATADAVKLTEATPEHGFRNRSPAEWDPEANAPVFYAYLKDVVHTEEERQTLQEYAGYCLMYWALLFHKALFIVGPQASGKSTFLKVLQQILGKTTQLSPQQLVDDQFGAIELEDSWANIRSDIPSELLSNVGKFKEITAGDPIHARRMYQQGYTIEPTAKHLYSANQLPEVKIDDDAFFRRVMIVAFPKTVPREDRDPKLDEKLSLELGGILRWAVEGLQRLLDNEGFTRELTPQETRRLWDEHASSIGQFKIRRLKVTDHNADVEAKKDVYKAYAKFCQDNGLPTESQRKLTRVLKRDPRIRQAKRKPEGWDKRTKCYVGIRLPTGDENDENPEIPF